MADFPTLSTPPVYPLKEKWGGDDQTIKSATEAGYVVTRSRYTRNRKTFVVRYENISAADKSALDTFLDTVNGATDFFNWTHPASSVVYIVRFEKPLEFELANFDGASYYYNVEFVLIEV